MSRIIQIGRGGGLRIYIALRRIFGPKTEKETEDWRKLHTYYYNAEEEWERHVERMKSRKCIKIWPKKT
jgi:hypothetical protein